MNRHLRTTMFYVAALALALFLASSLPRPESKPQELGYTEFIQQLEAGKVASVRIVDRVLTGKLADGTQFKTVVLVDGTLLDRLQAHSVVVTMDLPAEPAWWIGLLGSIIPLLILGGLLLYFMQQMQAGGNRAVQFSRSRAKLHQPDRRVVTFADVAGIDEVKEEMEEVVDFLRHPNKYLELGARIPKGILLVGAPGTGKTHLARAVSGEAGVPFFTISGSDFVEMFVGVGASRVRDLFETAKKHQPCIVFIDEIDAVGRQRGAGYGGGHDEREQTLNQLLVEMDGFGVNEGVIIMAATNRPDVLDPALLRPGRFDRQVVIDRPDLTGREAILKVHVRGKPLDTDVDLNVLAKRIPGFTGADIESLVNEAALLTVRRRKDRIGMVELEAAIDRTIAGPERKSRIISEKEKRTVAYHEAAHALVARKLPNTDPVHKVSVVPRGSALGYVLQLPIEDRYLITRSEILERVTATLAGRAAEEMIFGEASTGAHDDLDKASKLVRRMVTEYGMSEKLGPLTFGTGEEQQVFLGRDITKIRNYSEEVAAVIDREVHDLIHACNDRAKAILVECRGLLDRIASALLEHETLEGPQLEDLLAATCA
ncbi:MAG: ATP-dependent zinc metalloprotease FtsH [Bacillota bacterium]